VVMCSAGGGVGGSAYESGGNAPLKV